MAYIHISWPVYHVLWDLFLVEDCEESGDEHEISHLELIDTTTVSPHLQTGAAPSQKWWTPEMLLKQGTKKKERKERKKLQPGPGDARINAAEMRYKKPYSLALVMPALIGVSFIQAVRPPPPPPTLVPITSSRDTTHPHSNSTVFHAIPTPLPHNDRSHTD